MSCHNYKRKFPDHLLVNIEEFNKQDGTVLFDFFDSNEFRLFTNFTNTNFVFFKPSMILLKNYTGRTIQENTIYAVRPEVIQAWQEQNLIKTDAIDSFLIGYFIDASNTVEPIFHQPVSPNDFNDFFTYQYLMRAEGDSSNLSFSRKGKVSATVRNVGQGNWNEINFDDKVQIVFDAGAPMTATKKDIRSIIGNRNILYSKSKPILILSHWDKDHYHALIGMTDPEIQNNFSAVVCRHRVPNLTSRILFGGLRAAIGSKNVYSISADQRFARGGPTYFRPLTPSNQQVVLYNSQNHKNRNISGLAMSVKTKNGSIILSGDAHYDQISRDILSHLNYRHNHSLVVPHHGGKAGVYKYNIPALASPEKAVISVGANDYGHPLSNNIDSLRASGFSTHQTNIMGADITIRL